jgi:hypothetical protein
MRAIMESAFSIAYLITVLTLGCVILRNCAGSKQYKVFGAMTQVLGCGDAFHLVPRIIGLLGPGLEKYTAALGIGTLVASVSMTIFYVMLYHVWLLRYQLRRRVWLTGLVYALAIIRVALCLFPQNRWTDADSPVSWGIYRNIPFVILGLIIIILYHHEAALKRDKTFCFMWLAALLSFAFYIPVVLWADANPLVGMLMLPKTCAYVWMVWMGYSGMKKTRRVSE